MGIFESIKNAFGKAESEAEATESPEQAESRAEAPVAGEADAQEAHPAPAGESETTFYTVEPGDTLWRISERMYGDGSKYEHIFDANRDQLESPDHILPGQELLIPRLDG